MSLESILSRIGAFRLAGPGLYMLYGWHRALRYTTKPVELHDASNEHRLREFINKVAYDHPLYQVKLQARDGYSALYDSLDLAAGFWDSSEPKI